MGIQTSTINSGPVSGFKNKIINGNFDFWQRGTSFSGTGNQYTADRWYFTKSGAGTGFTVSQQSFTLGQTDVPNNPTYFCRLNITSTTNLTNISLSQYIEGVRTLAGQQVTVSFWAKASATTTLPNIWLQQDFGTGGSPSAVVITQLATNQSISTTWTRYSYTTTLPSISGKTLGTNGNDLLRLYIDFTMAVVTVDIAQVQVEQGPVATSFEQRPQQTELALCQRYFYSYIIGTNQTGTFPNLYTSYASAGGSVVLVQETAVTMRTSPNHTKVGTWNVSNCAQPTIAGGSNTSFSHQATVTAAGAAQSLPVASGAGYTLDAEL